MTTIRRSSPTRTGPALNGLLLTISLAAAIPGTGVQWRAFCLQPRDVPKGFVQTTARVVTNQDLARVRRAQPAWFADMGRIGGYETEYRRPPTCGIYLISDDVSGFRSAQGAERFQTGMAASTKESTWYGKRPRPVPGMHVGDEVAAFSSEVVLTGLSHTSITIQFRRGRLAGSVTAEGYSGTFTMAQVVGLARTIDARFEGRGGHGSRPSGCSETG